YDRTFLAGTLREAWRRRWRLYLGLGAAWIWLGWLVLAFPVTTAGRGPDTLPPLAYALTQGPVLLGYLRLAVWPAPLVFDYGLGPSAPMAALWSWALIGTLAALSAAACARRSGAGFLGAMVWLTLAPSSSVFPIGDVMAEHRMYLALAAIIILAVLLAERMLRLAVAGGRRAPLAASVLAIVVGVFTAMTAARNEAYYSRAGMWSDVIAKRPENARAHYNLGIALAERGRADDAIAAYRRTLALRPDYAEALNAWGAALVRTGRELEARPYFEAALALWPESPDAQMNLGDLAFRSGDWVEAEARYASAAAADPALADVRHRLGIALAQQGRAEDALAWYREALSMSPDDAEIEHSLGVALAMRGRFADARGHLERAVGLRAGYAEARNSLGAVLAQQGEWDAAERELRAALAIRPDYADAHANLGHVLLERGDADGAIGHMTEALRLNPGSGALREHLARAQARRGVLSGGITASPAPR
ncbi:MAG TPA: tetratricopeptide repeat protein, partial [Gemmatimonadales bacterium]